MTVTHTPRRLVVVCSLFLFSLACGPDTSTPDENGVNADPGATPGPGGKGDIIGEDDRRDEFSEDVSPRLREIARSTAMIIENTNVVDLGDGTVQLSGPSLEESYYMCPGETFGEQSNPGFCSAWLVGPDTIMTNGHCITSQTACENSSFVFDFAITEEGADPTIVPAASVVPCERVLAWDETSLCDVDFALLKLKREVTDRAPVTVRSPDEDFQSDNLVIIGHPFGLPRKYALEGKVIHDGSNGFLTTHDIFGGNSGSAIFDAESGHVQGLVTCGGSNLEWYYWEEGWELETKTGQPCDATCDDDGVLVDGSWEDVTCADNGNLRRRCVCDGTQLVYETRECLPFEDETGGQCAAEATSDQFTCETAPWLCATPFAQHTSNFYHYLGEWDTFAANEPVSIPAGETVTTTIEVDASGVIDWASITLDFSEEVGLLPENIDQIQQTLQINFLGENGELVDYVLDGTGTAANAMHAYDLSNNEGNSTHPLDVPFLLSNLTNLEAGSSYTLELTNTGDEEITLHGWSVNLLLRESEEGLVAPAGPCVSDCEPHYVDWPEPLVEGFGSDPIEVDEELVSGTIAEGWKVEVLDEEGADYEVFKTRRSQTMALTSGEFAIVRDFGEDIGARDLTIDYRHDGEGWFQVWVDDQIIFTETEFAQQETTVSIPYFARSVKFVLGAPPSSERTHEVTLYSLTLSSPPATPAEEE